MGPTVNEACELLHEALKDQVARVRGEVARVSAVDDYAAARAALTRAEQLDALLADLAELQKRAHALTGGASGATEPEASLPERVGQRPPPASERPQDA